MLSEGPEYQGSRYRHQSPGDSLESDGLVERVRHLGDRRAYLITLTEAGRAHYEQAEAVDTRALADATGTLSGEEREQLRALLAKVREAVRPV